MLCTWQAWNWVIEWPGQWVIWVIFHVLVTGSSVHQFDPVWDPSFSGFPKKIPKMQNVHLKCWNDKRCLLLDWNHWMSVHAMNFYFYLWLLKILWPENTSSWRQWRHCSHTPTHKSTFGVHYRTGSPGQLGLRVAGFPGNWVAGSQDVIQFHIW